MDIEFARTFLAVAAAGNFVGAAARLHVTQSTVSARIQTLESKLGAQLFRRGRGGAELTIAGQRFLRHAKTLVQTLEAARHDVGLPAGFRGSLTLAARIALWEGYLPRWVEWMQLEAGDISLRMETGIEDEMMQGLVQGNIDIGLMYTPENRPGLGIERLFDETLVLVSTNPSRGWPDPGYIHIGWGAEFHAQFSTRYPDIPPPALTANIGWLAMQCLFHSGGSAFLPIRIARRWLQQDRLFRVVDGPQFSLPVYMVYPTDRAEENLATALIGLRLLAVEEQRLAQ
ncbi:MAG: LysR family transcriptional regulator [Thiohalomonadaceae bacterium]